jgi:hypothetical protein
MSARDEIAAAHELLRAAAPRIDAARAPAVAALRPARVRVSVDGVLAELLGAVADAFPATVRVLGAVKGGTTGWLEEYLRSDELRARPASTRFATLGQIASTFPPFVRRVVQPFGGTPPAELRALLNDALDSEAAINDLRQPDPALAVVLHRLSGPFAQMNERLSPAEVRAAPAVVLAAHARLGTYGRDVAMLRASARSGLAGFLSPAEWIDALATNPTLAVRAGAYHCAHVLRPTGEVATVPLAPATAAAAAAGPLDPRDPAFLDDLLRLAAAGALRAGHGLVLL